MGPPVRFAVYNGGLIRRRPEIPGGTMTDAAPFAATAEMDARGLRCPLPLLRARQAMRGLAAGDVLLLRATDPGARRDIPAWLDQAGHRLLAVEEGAGELRFWIRHEGEGR